MKSLIAIQHELKAPKGQYNSFGKYKYRSCEDILEAVKPLLNKYNCSLVITDSLEQVGERYYVKATATLMTADEKAFSVSAFAREADAKKGMDESQITGTASSYARKYALNGLFLIDDTKDADTDENTAQRESVKMEANLDKKITKKELAILQKTLTDNQAAWVLSKFKIGDLSELTGSQYAEIFKTLNERAQNGK